MRRTDPAVLGPERATLRDIEPLNRVFADAFTDRYHRDGMTGVRVPPLNPEVWRYAIEAAGDGAMLWRDAEGRLAGFNLVHLSGAEGWMGPLAVRPALQGAGLGRRIVGAGIEWLTACGARVIGLETMPRTVDNVGFYGRLGFVPGHLTITVMRDLEPGLSSTPPGIERLSAAGPARAVRLEECRALTGRLAPEVDYTRELALTGELGLGDTTLLRRGDTLAAFALWHRAPLSQGRRADELRVLKLVATDLDALSLVLEGVAGVAAAEPSLGRVAVRCQTEYPEVYPALLAAGYRAVWTDLRMVFRGAAPAVVVPASGAGGGREGIVLSNWEI